VVAAYLADLDLTRAFIRAVSVTELQRRINLLREREPARAQRLRTWLEAFVLPSFEGRVLPFHPNVAREWGRLMGTEAEGSA